MNKNDIIKAIKILIAKLNDSSATEEEFELARELSDFWREKKLAESEAKVMELEAKLKSETLDLWALLRSDNLKLQIANAVLQKKLEKAVEQRNEQIDREFHESQANERDARKGILNLQLSRITAESIAKE